MSPSVGLLISESVTTVDVLLFDLGGVLVDFSGVRDLALLLPGRPSESEVLERWSVCPHTEQFHLGKLNQYDFGDRFVRDWHIDLSPEDFLRAFRSWSRGLFPGASDLLASLRPRFRLAALSNSNELHWQRNTIELGITGLFEVAISSHQIGICKPNPGIYLAALDQLCVSPSAVVFFDDVSVNVEAASALGIQSFQVKGVGEVRERLIREQLL